MNDLVIGLLSAVLATNQPAAISNLVRQKTGLALNVPDKNDPVEKEFHKLLDADDAAQAEVDKWITERPKTEAENGGIEKAAIRARIKQRFDPVREGYEDFLKRHPAHARAHLAYGSFLNDIHDEDAALAHWEKARELDPKNPAAWNNLANYYGHNGQVTNSFVYYAKAIELEPDEPVYYQNLATTLYMFRQDAMAFFKIEEPVVFDRAMALYRQALALDPENFLLASELAQSYYGIKLPKLADAQAAQRLHAAALAAWENALKLARDDVEREGVQVHLARVSINAGNYDTARLHLGLVTNAMFNVTKTRMLKNLLVKEGKSTNAPAPPSELNLEKK